MKIYSVRTPQGELKAQINHRFLVALLSENAIKPVAKGYEFTEDVVMDRMVNQGIKVYFWRDDVIEEWQS